MASLTLIERRTLERLFDMGSGYVLDFSNRTFADFVVDSVGLDIYSDKYSYGSGSKANRLRAFWDKESDLLVGTLTNDLIEYFESTSSDSNDLDLAQARRIVKRLLHGAPVEDFQAITSELSDPNFEVVVRAVKAAIDKSELDAGLDRLHTFTVKYIRHLSSKRGVDADRNKPLHSLFGEYVKKLRTDGLIESDMTDRILKSSIATLEAFNRVRNDQSLAHDNPVLNHGESLLIFNHVCGVLRFIRDIEGRTRSET